MFNRSSPIFSRVWFGCLTLGGLCFCAATVLGFFGGASWFFDLFSHFRVQYLLGLLALSTLLLFGGYRKTAAVFAVIALLNFSLVLPFYLSEGASTNSQVKQYRAMLFNVNTRQGDPELVRQVIESSNPDIIALLEISPRWAGLLEWIKQKYSNSVVELRNDNFGIGLFSKIPLVEAQVAKIGEARLPSIVAKLSTSPYPVQIIATHPLPPTNREYSELRNDQLEQISDYISHPSILLGDLNLTPWSYHFQRLISRTALKDSSRGFGIQPTWPSLIPFLLIPIDHFLHSDQVVIIDRSIGDSALSDHFPVIVDFRLRD